MLESKDSYRAKIEPDEDIVRLEYGWIYQVISIDRVQGIFSFRVKPLITIKPPWWARWMGCKFIRVIDFENK